MTGDIPTRRIGGTDVAVTVLGFGGAPLGELFETVPEERAQATLAQAWSSGIRFYDTAPWYGHGLSEHRLGHALRQRPRDEFVLSTKVGRVYSRPRDPADFSTEPWVGGLPFELRFDYGHDGIMRSYEDSLLRLGVNRADVLVIHDLDAGYHQPAEVLEAHRRHLEDSGWAALESLRGDEEIRGIGAGINDAAMMGYFLERFDLDFFLVAMPYTLLDQGPLEHELETCRRRGIGVVVGSPFASGILATGPVEGAVYNYAPADADVLEKTRRIEDTCRRHGVSLQAAALQFPLGHPAVAAVIPGVSEPSLVDANLRNLRVPIPHDLWRELKDEELLARDAPLPPESGFIGASAADS